MASKLRLQLNQLIRRYAPEQRQRASTIRRFAAKLGLVYFGSVDQHDDDHDVIRGMSVSMTHRDSHYAVGNFEGYDISMADRFDIVRARDGRYSHHQRLILRINLMQPGHLPHLFLQPLHTSKADFTSLFTPFRHLQPVSAILQHHHSDEFHQRYELYAASSHALDVETVLTPMVTATIAARFWPQAIEVQGNTLYVYIAENRLSAGLLDSVLQSSIWLAQVLDAPHSNV